MCLSSLTLGLQPADLRMPLPRAPAHSNGAHANPGRLQMPSAKAGWTAIHHTLNPAAGEPPDLGRRTGIARWRITRVVLPHGEPIAVPGGPGGPVIARPSAAPEARLNRFYPGPSGIPYQPPHEPLHRRFQVRCAVRRDTDFGEAAAR